MNEVIRLIHLFVGFVGPRPFFGELVDFSSKASSFDEELVNLSSKASSFDENH